MLCSRSLSFFEQAGTHNRRVASTGEHRIVASAFSGLDREVVQVRNRRLDGHIWCHAGALAPPPDAGNAMVNGGMRPRAVIQEYHASFLKVLGVLVAIAAVGLTALAKIGSLLLHAAGL